MGKSKSPPPPDYAAAAREQGTANVAAATATAALNNPNQVTPYGNQSWTLRPGADPKNPQAGDWTVTTTLSPEQQAQKAQEDRLSSQYGNLAQNALGQLGQTFGTNFDPSSLPQLQTLSTQGLSAQGTVPTAPTNLQGVTANPQAYQGVIAAPGTNTVAGPGQRTIVQDTGIYQNSPQVPLNRQGVESQGLQDFSLVQGGEANSRNNVENALYQRQTNLLDPQTGQQRQDLEARLASQGITQGSAAYSREFDNLSRQQGSLYAQARNDAILAGGAEDTRVFGKGLAASQQANALRNQQLGERFSLADFNNTNQDTSFSQGLASAGFNNQVASDAFGRQLQAAGFNNATDSQLLQDRIAVTGFNNQAGSQGLQDRLASTGFNNQVTSRNFQEQLAANDFNNQNIRDQFSLGLAGSNAQNANRAQQFNEFQAVNSSANQVSDQALRNALLARQNSLNEANALRTGNQLVAPQFGQFAGGNVQAAPIFQGIQAGYDANVSRTNANNARYGGLLSAAGQLGSAAFLASDRRLKENIRKIGKLANGLNWYSFNYKNGRKAEGVMSDEVRQILPEAVRKRALDGFDEVNYQLIGGF